MKNYLLALVVSLAAIDLAFAGFMNKSVIDKQKQLECLHNNGLNNSTDIDLMKDFLRRDAVGQKGFHLEKQFTCALTCIIKVLRKNPQLTIYQQIAEIIEYDDQIPPGQKRSMKHRLEDCNRENDGDDCKLLFCIKIFRSPFKHTLKL